MSLSSTRRHSVEPLSATYCFGAVFLEGVFLFGVFPYMAEFLRTEGESRASISGIVIAGFGIGGVVYTFMVGWLLEHFRANANSWLPWPVEFANFMQFGVGGSQQVDARVVP